MLLCVDASGSMAARRRMDQVKTAVLHCCWTPTATRPVGLVTFRDTGGYVILPPTGSVDVAAARLRELPAGGRTPLAEGLLRPRDAARASGQATPDAAPCSWCHRRPGHRRPDGSGALVARRRPPGPRRGRRAGHRLETGRFRMGLAAALARRMGAEYVHVGEVSAEAITSAHVAGATDEGALMPQGQPLVRPRRRAHHPPAPQPAAAHRAHR